MLLHIWCSQALEVKKPPPTTFVIKMASRHRSLSQILKRPPRHARLARKVRKYHAVETWESPLSVMCTECEMIRNASEISRYSGPLSSTRTLVSSHQAMASDPTAHLVEPGPRKRQPSPTTFRSQNGIKTSVSKVNFLKDRLGMPDWNLEYEKYHALEVWEPLRVMCTECEMTRNASEISGHYILYPQLELPSKCPACLF